MVQRFAFLMVVALLQASIILAPLPAQAQAGGTPTTTSESAAAPKTCTNFLERKECAFNGNCDAGSTGASKGPTDGLLSEIYLFIKEIVDESTRKLYMAFIGNEGYQKAVFAAMTLMIAIFGIGFTIGVVQPSFGQALMRLIKFAVVAAMVSPAGWQFFSDPTTGAGVVAFFNDGTDELVKGVMEIGMGSGLQPPPEGSTPFYRLDRLADFMIQPDTIIAILGSTFASGPYGLAMGGLMMFAFFGFVRLLVQALKVYAVSFVARSLLLGIAPIFIVFLLFDKTKQLFMTWINALLSLSLQPILLFTFLSFFIVLIESAATDLLKTEFCWTSYQNVNGSQNLSNFWRPVENGAPLTGDMTWKGSFECIMSGKNNCPEFPIDIVSLLTFLILVYLAERFASIIQRIAYELSNAFIALDAGGRLDQFMKETGMQSMNPFSGARNNNSNPSRSAPSGGGGRNAPSSAQQTNRPGGAG